MDTPTLDATLPAFRGAVHQVRLKLELLQAEQPNFTPLQALQEARRWCIKTMLAACDEL